MSDAPATGFGDFGKWVPGFDFLQSLTKPQASSAAASPLGHWVAPTLNVEELDKRIQELKSVEGWLNMNLNMLRMAIQGLEMQKSGLEAMQQAMNIHKKP